MAEQTFTSGDRHISVSPDIKNLMILLLVAGLVRFVGIAYGLPSVYNSTEYFIAKQALSLGARKTLEPLFFIYPTFYIYIIAALYAGFFLTGKLTGGFAAPADFALLFFSDPTIFYLLGRILNALALLAAVLLFYKAVRYFLDEQLSLLMGLLFIFVFNFNFFGFWMVPDAFLILGTVILLYFWVRLYKTGISARLIYAGSLVCGLTISTKYNAGFLAVGWLLAVWILNAPPVRPGPKVKTALLSLLLIVSGFVLGTPYWLLRFGSFYDGFKTIWSQSYYAYNLETGLPYLWELGALLKTEWLLGLAFIGILLTFWVRLNRFKLSLMAVVIPTFLLVGSWEKKGLDYLLVIFPVLLVLLAARLSGSNIKRITRRTKIFALGLMLIFNAPRVLYLNFLHLQKDTRQMTGDWIVNNIDQQDKICYDHYHYDIGIIDVSRFVEYGAGSRYLSPVLKKKVSTLKSAPNNYSLVTVRQEMDVRSLPDSLQQRFADDPFVMEGLSHPHKTLSELLREGVSFLILNSDTYRLYLENPPPANSNPLRGDFLNTRAFYRAVFEKLKPVAQFSPGWNTPGPVMQIYDLRNLEK